MYNQDLGLMDLVNENDLRDTKRSTQVGLTQSKRDSLRASLLFSGNERDEPDD